MHCLEAESQALLPNYRFERSRVAAVKIRRLNVRFEESISVGPMAVLGPLCDIQDANSSTA
jgi:hypothetical protein